MRRYLPDPTKTAVLVNPSRRRMLQTSMAGGLAIAGGSLLPRLGRAETNYDAKLKKLGVILPEVPPPVANYVPYAVANGFVYCAGQLAFKDGKLMFPGQVPDDVSLEEAQAAAKQCAINLIAAVKAACGGNLRRVRRCVRMQGFVASADGFHGQSKVMNGASDLMVAVFGDAGRHTRLALGANVLPLNASVEISGIFALAS